MPASNCLEIDRACHKKHWISNGNKDFLVLLFACLFPFISFTPLLSSYFVFEHVSGSWLLSDWNRCCAWIVVALFWCDCSSMCEYVRRLWWKWVFFPSALSYVWLGVKARGAIQPTLSDRERTQLQLVNCAMCGCGCACFNKYLGHFIVCCIVWRWWSFEALIMVYLGCRCFMRNYSLLFHFRK